MRLVPYARVRRDEDDQVIGFLPQAFALREDEDYLSAAWIEFFKKPTHLQNIHATLKAFAAALKVRKSARFALGNVGTIKAACKQHGQSVRISHEPLDGFDAHASVRQINTDDDQLLELLASEAWAEMHKPLAEA
jgi:hypothetical protein